MQLLEILFFGEGSKLKKTSWTIQCLAPKKGEIKSATENDSSMVLRLDYGNVTFWFMADIEKEGEKQLEKQLTGSFFARSIADITAPNS